MGTRSRRHSPVAETRALNYAQARDSQSFIWRYLHIIAIFAGNPHPLVPIQRQIILYRLSISNKLQLKSELQST